MRHPADHWLAILRHPHDDAPRMAYAERLDLSDDPLGGFIRLQCSLESVELAPALKAGMETTSRELIARHGPAWSGPLAEWAEWATFRRGFVDEIALSASRFVRHAAEIYASAPVRVIHLTGARDKAADLAATPEMAHVGFLDLSDNCLRDAGVRALARSPYLTSLEGLNLTSTHLADDGVRALCEAHLPSLRELYLCDNHIGAEGLRRLERSPLGSRLETLTVGGNPAVRSASRR